MIVEDPGLIDNPVRADSLEARNGFMYKDEPEEEYCYFMPMKRNVNLSVKVKRGELRLTIEPKYVLVFNVTFNTIGIVKADQIVEPVNMKVLVTS